MRTAPGALGWTSPLYSLCRERALRGLAADRQLCSSACCWLSMLTISRLPAWSQDAVSKPSPSACKLMCPVLAAAKCLWLAVHADHLRGACMVARSCQKMQACRKCSLLVNFYTDVLGHGMLSAGAGLQRGTLHI